MVDKVVVPTYYLPYYVPIETGLPFVEAVVVPSLRLEATPLPKQNLAACLCHAITRIAIEIPASPPPFSRASVPSITDPSSGRHGMLINCSSRRRDDCRD
jgi:hypothetical protein